MCAASLDAYDISCLDWLHQTTSDFYCTKLKNKGNPSPLYLFMAVSLHAYMTMLMTTVSHHHELHHLLLIIPEHQRSWCVQMPSSSYNLLLRTNIFAGNVPHAKLAIRLFMRSMNQTKQADPRGTERRTSSKTRKIEQRSANIDYTYLVGLTTWHYNMQSGNRSVNS